MCHFTHTVCGCGLIMSSKESPCDRLQAKYISISHISSSMTSIATTTSSAPHTPAHTCPSTPDISHFHDTSSEYLYMHSCSHVATPLFRVVPMHGVNFDSSLTSHIFSCGHVVEREAFNRDDAPMYSGMSVRTVTEMIHRDKKCEVMGGKECRKEKMLRAKAKEEEERMRLGEAW